MTEYCLHVRDKYFMLYPYENVFEAFHLAMSAAQSPITSAVQSNNMWKPSDMSPRLLVHAPYNSSIPVNAWNSSNNSNV